MAQSTESVSIKVHPTVLARLNQLKGQGSNNSIIDKMLTFFEVTGARPGDYQTHPSLQLKREIEQLKKMMKAQERDKIDVMFKILKELQERKLPNAGITLTSEDLPTLEQVATVAAENERLQEELRQEKATNEQLQLSMRQQQVQAPAEGIDTKQAAELLTVLQQNCINSKFSQDDYTIKKDVVRLFMERMKNLLKLG